MRVVIPALVFVAFTGGVAVAAELVPGQSARSIDEPGEPVFSPTSEAPARGQLVDQRSVPFDFSYQDEQETGGQVWFSRGTFTTSVYRREDGRLSFLHELDEQASNHVNDLEFVDLNGFRSLTTDVYAFEGFEEFGVSRSSDGDAIRFGFNLEHIDGTFLVLTNATEYALAPGAVRVEMDFAFTGDQSQNFTAFAPVPEPSATAVFVAAAGATALRRRRRAS